MNTQIRQGDVLLEKQGELTPQDVAENVRLSLRDSVRDSVFASVQDAEREEFLNQARKRVGTGREYAYLPTGSVKVKPQNGRLILRHGEATGHHHSVDARTAELWQLPDGSAVDCGRADHD